MNKCNWCELEFTKTTNNQRYCSKECYDEKARTEKRVVKRKAYDPRRYDIVGTPYMDYEQPDLSTYTQPRLEIKKDTFSMTPVKVPETSFKRFKETKNVIVFMSNQELQRLKDRKRAV